LREGVQQAERTPGMARHSGTEGEALRIPRKTGEKPPDENIKEEPPYIHQKKGLPCLEGQGTEKDISKPPTTKTSKGAFFVWTIPGKT